METLTLSNKHCIITKMNDSTTTTTIKKRYISMKSMISSLWPNGKMMMFLDLIHEIII